MAHLMLVGDIFISKRRLAHLQAQIQIFGSGFLL
jgi:hypothetical protein